MKNSTLIVDGMNYLHRGFYATPPMYNKDGLATNAIRGFINILLADIKHVSATHCAIVFDRPGQNFRHRLYPEYKAQRSKDGPDLRPSVTPIRHLCSAMGIPVYGKRGIEGDDMIGSLAVRASKKSMVHIASNDKDFAALVNKRINLLRPKGIKLDADGVFEEYGVWPEQIVDYLTMLGDGVDNIPGIDKVGPKTASKLLAEFGTLKKVYQKAQHSVKMQANFDKAKKFIPTAQKLITIDTSRFPNFELEQIKLGALDTERIDAICAELDFKSTRTSIYNTLRK